MREVADADRIGRFMRALAEAAEANARVYFAGGATAVLMGWRSSTIDVETGRAWQYFRIIEPDLYRFPAVDARAFRQAMEEVLGPPPSSVSSNN